VDDKNILYSFIAGFALNAILALQMAYYWNAPTKGVKAKGKGKEKQTFLDSEGEGENYKGYEGDDSSSESDLGTVVVFGSEDDESESESNSDIGPLLASEGEESEEASEYASSEDEEGVMAARDGGFSFEELRQTLELNDLIIAWQEAIERSSSPEVEEQGSIEGSSSGGEESGANEESSTAVESSQDEGSSTDEESSGGEQSDGGVSLAQLRDTPEANNAVSVQ